MSEILAPVGGKEQLYAAVRSGCDAVYLGGKNFNARRNADNFDTDSLKDIVKYCHVNGIKVYVTLNTLVMDSEISAVVEEIKEIAYSGADAVIVQDMGVFNLVRNMVPSIPIHGSTQMTIHNLSGVLFAEKMGFKRIVLARELSFEEIKYIITNSNIEIEVFVHGALCMSMSGSCYLSSILGGRSGNRGLCAQPCRLDFNYGDKNYALSLKDMSYVEQLMKLQNIGVTSFKIEGRMKRPEYVAAVVSACRDVLSNKNPNMDVLKSVFSRQGFTQDYLLGNRTSNLFGHRSYEDVTSFSKVGKAIEALYKNETCRIPVKASLVLSEGKECLLALTDGKNAISTTGPICEVAKSTINQDVYSRSIHKMGGTPFYVEDINIKIEGNPFVSAAMLNELRRNAVDKLIIERGKFEPYSIYENANIETEKYISKDNTEIYVRCLDIAQAINLTDAEKIILPLKIVVNSFEKLDSFSEKVIVELPPVCFPLDEDRVVSQMQLCKNKGYNSVWCDNLGLISKAKELNLKVYGGYGLNIMNTISVKNFESLDLEAITVSFELNANKIRKLGGKIKRGVIGYGYLPLMKTRACPIKSSEGCKKCTGNAVILDRKGVKFKYICSDRRYGTLLNSVPLYIGDKNVSNVDFYLLWYNDEKAERCKEVFDMFKNHKEFDLNRTCGLYYRDLL